jgi:hypothetical protein
MAAHIENAVLDQALNYLNANGNRVDLCGTEPTTYTEATSTYTLANATNGAGFTAPLFSAPGNRAPNGRQVTTAVVSGAAVTGTGTANWVAYSKTTATAALLVVLSMTAQALTSGNTWGQAASTVGIPNQ